LRAIDQSRLTALRDIDKAPADALGQTADENRLIMQIFISTKKEFEREAAEKGLKNNVAGALTLFMAAAAMVYNNSEPAAEATDVLSDAIDAGIDEMPVAGLQTDKNKAFTIC